MKIIILINLFIFSFLGFAESPLSQRLRSFESYNKFYEKFNVDEDGNVYDEFAIKAKEAYTAQKRLETDPNYRARLFYQDDILAKPCAHCPQYLNLIKEVNKIVEKVPEKNIKVNNEKIIAVSKLNFLYYMVKSTEEKNEIRCKLVTNLLPSQISELNSGRMNLAAEQALQLKDVSSVQLYEGDTQEIHYFYRGDYDQEKNIIIEVVSKPNGSAIIKYYKFDPGFNLPDLGSKIEISDNNLKKKNFIELNPTVETKKSILVEDVKIGKIGNNIPVTDELKLKHETSISINKQQTVFALENEKGKQYLAVQGTNILDGKKTFNAIINYDFDLPNESKYKVGTSINNKIEYDVKSTSPATTQVAKISLTDHNNELINFKTAYDEKGLLGLGLGNKIKSGDGNISLSADFDRDGNKNYSIKANDQGVINAAGLNVKENKDGSKNYGATLGTSIDSKTNIKTEYSKNSKGVNSYSLILEKNISETTSMVLTLKTDDKAGANILYQFRSKF